MNYESGRVCPVIRGLTFVMAFAFAAKTCSADTAPSGKPSEILTHAAASAVAITPTVVASAENASAVFISVSPDKRLVSCAVQYVARDAWEFVIVQPNSPGKRLRYAGQAKTGFGVFAIVWSPSGDEMAVGVGYRDAIVRWVRVRTDTFDPAFARTCREMAGTSEDIDLLVAKNQRTEWPVWGVNGQFYATPRDAAKDGTTRFQPGNASPSDDGASRVTLFEKERTFTVLVDNVERMAHAFAGNRYIESFPVVAGPQGGWWFVTHRTGGIVGARQFAAATSPSDPAKTDLAKPAEWHWVKVDLGSGVVCSRYEMRTGPMVVMRDGTQYKVALIDTAKAEQSVKQR